MDFAPTPRAVCATFVFMPVDIFLRGLVLGFSIAAPVGPIGLLTIRRTLAHGRAHGLATGLGAATADAAYGTIAAFGLSVVAQALADQQTPFRLAGGAFLIYLGIRIFLSKPVLSGQPQTAGGGMFAAYVTAVALTLTNPATILSFAGMFAGMGATESPVALVLGVFAGSALWWLLLSTLVGALRRGISLNVMRWVNRASGALLATFGMAVMASVVV